MLNPYKPNVASPLESSTIPVSASNEYAGSATIVTVILFLAWLFYMIRKRFFTSKKSNETLLEGKGGGADDFFEKYI